MFERYTEKARRVIFFARYEASQFGAPAIEPEHLLLGLMREDKTLTGRFFPRAQVSIESIRKEIEGRTLLREKISTSVELPLAPETKHVLAYAHEESDRLQHRHIGTEHLLLGLLREERSMAAEILFGMGITLDEVRARVARQSGADAAAQQGEALDVPDLGQKLSVLASQFKRHLRMMETGVKEMSSYTELLLGGTKSEQPPVMKELKSVRSGRRTVLGIENRRE